MKNLAAVLSDPIWWFTVVVAGLVINVLANFLFRRLDRQLSNLSETRRIQAARRQVARGERVALLRTHDRLLLLSLFEDLRYRSRATIFFIFALALMVVGGQTFLPVWVRAVLFLWAAVIFTIGQLAAREAARILFEVIDSGLPTPAAPDPKVGSPPEIPETPGPSGSRGGT